MAASRPALPRGIAPEMRAPAVRASHACRSLALLAWLAGSLAQATPREIVIVRHGEKHAQAESKDGELRVRGCDRAYQLPKLFSEKDRRDKPHFDPPVAVYAVRPGPGYRAIRAAETAAPTAETYGTPLIVVYTREQQEAVAREILSKPAYDGKTVLIVWEHHAVPALAKALKLPDSQNPGDWPNSVFDQEWVIDYDKSGKFRSFAIEPEELLPGDNPKGGKLWVKGRDIPDNDPLCMNEGTGGASPPGVIAASPCANDDDLNRKLTLLAPGLLPLRP